MMNKLKKIISSPVFSIGAVVIAAGLLIFASVGGARAALTIFSDDYKAQVELYDIGVSLLENDEVVAWRNYNSEADGTWDETPGDEHIGALCVNMLGDDAELKLGKVYDEVLTVKNSGTIDEFVRVSVTKYWLDPDGNKTQNLDPSLINLNLVTNSGWVEDTSSATSERTVLYYTKMLAAGETTPAFTDTISFDDSLALEVTQEEATEVVDGVTYKTITTTYLYDNYSFVIEATVDAIQDHNAKDAAKSAWGRNVVIDGTTLTLQ